jgi:hypothetical protein
MLFPPGLESRSEGLHFTGQVLTADLDFAFVLAGTRNAAKFENDSALAFGSGAVWFSSGAVWFSCGAIYLSQPAMDD